MALKGTNTEGGINTLSTRSSTNVRVQTVSSFQAKNAAVGRHNLVPLPSYKYRHTVWHELRDNEIKGNQLHHPRIREAPEVKEEYFYTAKDQDGRRIHHKRKGKERFDYRNETENWEICLVANLSYQDLGYDYQKENFYRVLKRLIRVEKLQLVDNDIKDLSKLSFPKCTQLNLTRNYITSVKCLPRCPQLVDLNLSENHIQTLDQLQSLTKMPGLQTLNLRGNPVVHSINYRFKVFQALSNLKELDGIVKLASDNEEEEPLDDDQSSRCMLM